MNNGFTKINKFDEIFDNIKYINKNILFIFDVDETILYFNGINNLWWSKTFDKYYMMYMDYDLAEELSYNEWLIIISQNEPNITDKSLIKLLIHDHIYLSARKECDYDLTIKHLIKIYNINPKNKNELIKNHNIYHIDSKNKGEFIQKYIENKNYDYYIFIDDQEYNIKDMTELNIKNVDCYLFNFINE
jgi:hypothetical protein